MKKCKICHYRKAAKGRTCCNTCKTRRQRANNPMRAAFINLRVNAKRRGKAFELTFEEFQSFAIETDYIQNKGKTALSYSIDRIDNNKGYTIDNIRVLSLSDNTKKHTKILCYDWQTKTAIVKPCAAPNFEDVPF